MQPRSVTLAVPLQIDVAKIATYYHEFRYRGPVLQNNIYSAITSEFILNDKNYDKFSFLCFDDKTEAGFNTIFSEYSPRELAAFITRLPEELSAKLMLALKNTALEIQMLTEREYEELNAMHAYQLSRYEKFNAVRAPLKNNCAVNFDSVRAMAVLQHEYAVTSADADQFILGTFGADPCIILALYDEAAKKAVLAHIDAFTSLNSLDKLFSEVTPEHTVSHVVGGHLSTQNMCIEILELLEEKGIKIANADLVRFTGEPASLAIDSRNGTIYSPVEPDQLYKASNIGFRLQCVGLQYRESPLKQIFSDPHCKTSTRALLIPPRIGFFSTQNSQSNSQFFNALVAQFLNNFPTALVMIWLFVLSCTTGRNDNKQIFKNRK